MGNTIKIKYHPPGGFSDSIVTLLETEARVVYTKGVVITSVMNNDPHGITLVLYVDTLPARIDQQGDIIFLVGKSHAKQLSSPYGLLANYAFFGEPKTVWENTDLAKAEKPNYF